MPLNVFNNRFESYSLNLRFNILLIIKILKIYDKICFWYNSTLICKSNYNNRILLQHTIGNEQHFCLFLFFYNNFVQINNIIFFVSIQIKIECLLKESSIKETLNKLPRPAVLCANRRIHHQASRCLYPGWRLWI
jgi:hypothetical protein